MGLSKVIPTGPHGSSFAPPRCLYFLDVRLLGLLAPGNRKTRIRTALRRELVFGDPMKTMTTDMENKRRKAPEISLSWKYRRHRGPVQPYLMGLGV